MKKGKYCIADFLGRKIIVVTELEKFNRVLRHDEEGYFVKANKQKYYVNHEIGHIFKVDYQTAI